MQAILSEALPLIRTLKGVIQKWATKLTLIYLKAPRLNNSAIAYLIVFSEYGMTNASISSVALPLTATPKWVKRGNKIVIHLCKRTKVKITDIAYIRVLRVLTDQCKYRLALPLTATQKGVTKCTSIYVKKQC